MFGMTYICQFASSSISDTKNKFINNFTGNQMETLLEIKCYQMEINIAKIADVTKYRKAEFTISSSKSWMSIYSYKLINLFVVICCNCYS